MAQEERLSSTGPLVVAAGLGAVAGFTVAAIVWHKAQAGTPAPGPALPPPPPAQQQTPPGPLPAAQSPTLPRLPMPPAAPRQASPGIQFDPPLAPSGAQGDLAGQRRNYKAGYLHGLWVRANGSDGIVAQRGEAGLEPYYDQGRRDADAGRRPQLADAELLAAYAESRRQPGPAQS